MSRETRNLTARRSLHTVKTLDPRLRATCLLCRVLLPIVVQHRHLVFDDPFAARTSSLKPTDDEQIPTASYRFSSTEGRKL